MIAYFVFLLYIFESPLLVLAKRPAPPIEAEIYRKNNKAAECQLGREFKELGSTWFADLGPPFGVMYCIKCQCIAVQKKRRIVGKVHCKNIKHECPKPNCDEPVLQPGKCCKVCPEENNNLELPQDVASPQSLDDDDTNLKYFANLIVGEESATGRYSFHRRSLYYSFYATSRPQTVQFLDASGNILEEQELGPGSLYQNATNKICGVWRRIPREYRKMIREEKLTVGLIWPNKVAASGQITRYRTLQTEMYSSLLENDQQIDGLAGTAIVSVSTAPPSIHVTVVFAGSLFDGSETTDAPLSLKLATSDGETVVMDEVIRIEKASPDLNVIERSTVATGADLRLLSRNKLLLELKSKTSLRSIAGGIRPRAVCEAFQSLMKSDATTAETTTNSSGLAWFYVDRHGRLDYHVQIDRVNRPVIVGLVTEKKMIELEDLSPQLTQNGWTNGSLDAPSPKYLEMLYANELGVNVATTESKSVIKGRLTGKYVASPIDSKFPLLLTNEGLNPPDEFQTFSGLAWIDVDIDCNIQYEVELSKEGDYSLYVSHMPMNVPGAPVMRKLLDVGGSRIEGTYLGPLPHELQQLASGFVRVEIQHSAGQLLLRALWPQIEVPESCLSNNIPEPDLNEPYQSPLADSERIELPPPGPCLHGGRFHEDGAQWRSVDEPCTICHCHAGQLTCVPLVCPELPSSCARVTPKGPNQCCPICQNSTEDTALESSESVRGCQQAGQFFSPGSSWHPYLPPFGFDTCTVCSCHAVTLKVTCSRLECPSLECDERVAVRPTRKSCCKVCPSKLSEPSGSTASQQANSGAIQGEEAVTDSPEVIAEQILAAGGCRYPVGGPYHNGQQWHPRLYSHGEMKCVKCRCKDGKVKCERKKCTKWSCNDECCSAQCKRRRRNIRRHH